MQDAKARRFGAFFSAAVNYDLFTSPKPMKKAGFRDRPFLTDAYFF